MPRVKLELDAETHERLIRESVAHMRPVQWQAEQIVREHLALPEHERFALSAAYELLRGIAAKRHAADTDQPDEAA